MRAHYCWRGVGSVTGYLSALTGEVSPFGLPGASPTYPSDRLAVARHLHLDVKIDPATPSVEGRVTVLVMSMADGVDRVRLDASELEIDDVFLEGNAEPVRYEYDGRYLDVPLDSPISVNQTVSILIRYRVERPRLGLYFVGPTPSEPDRGFQVWSQNQDDDARYWFPCMDEPGLKLTTSAAITVPLDYMAVSNGTPDPEGPVRHWEDGWHTFQWRHDTPHPVYLTTIAIGKFVEHKEPGDQPEIRWYCLPGREDDAARAFGNTRKMVDFFGETIGIPYPWARYGQIAVKDFVFGGMENTTLTVITERALPDERAQLDWSAEGLVAHELAHQWFGDLVTCREWAHAWLHEGFATYFDCLYREHDLSRDEMDYELRRLAAEYFQEVAQRYDRPLVMREYDEPIEIFDRHLYNKGAWVLHMLRSQLGELPFRRGLRNYVHRFRFNQCETPDFRRAVEDATGRGKETVVLPGLGRPDLVVVDPDATLLCKFELELSPSLLLAALSNAPSVSRRIDAAVALGRRPSTVAIKGLCEALRSDPFWGVRGEVAQVLGRVGGALAEEALCAALTGEEHPKARRQVARALGVMRGSDAAATALSALIERGDPSYFVEAESLEALGKLRVEGAFEKLTPALEKESFCDVIRSGAIAGLCHLRTEAALDVIADWMSVDRPALVRLSATFALGRLGRDKPELQPRVLDLLEAAIHPMPGFRHQLALCSALGTLGAEAALPLLHELAELGVGGLVRRFSREHARSIRGKQDRTAPFRALRDDIEELRSVQSSLRDRVDRLGPVE